MILQVHLSIKEIQCTAKPMPNFNKRVGEKKTQKDCYYYRSIKIYRNMLGADI